MIWKRFRLRTVRLFGFSVILQFRRSVIPLFYCSFVPQFRCSAATLFYCSTVPQFGCSAVTLFYCSTVPQFRCSASPMFYGSVVQMSRYSCLDLYTIAYFYLSFRVSIIFNDFSAICRYFSRLFWNDPALLRRPLACLTALTSVEMIPKLMFIGSKWPMDDVDT